MVRQLVMDRLTSRHSSEEAVRSSVAMAAAEKVGTDVDRGMNDCVICCGAFACFMPAWAVECGKCLGCDCECCHCCRCDCDLCGCGDSDASS